MTNTSTYIAIIVSLSALVTAGCRPRHNAALSDTARSDTTTNPSSALSRTRLVACVAEKHVPGIDAILHLVYIRRGEAMGQFRAGLYGRERFGRDDYSMVRARRILDAKVEKQSESTYRIFDAGDRMELTIDVSSVSLYSNPHPGVSETYQEFHGFTGSLTKFVVDNEPVRLPSLEMTCQIDTDNLMAWIAPRQEPPCPSPGGPYRGHCYFKGRANKSCNDVCGAQGLEVDLAGQAIADSQDNDYEGCLGASHAAGNRTPTSAWGSTCNGSCQGAGCSYHLHRSRVGVCYPGDPSVACFRKRICSCK